jgi:hypothetical protein
MPQDGEDPRILRKRIGELEKEVREEQALIRLLAELPKPGSEPPPSEKSAAAKRRTRQESAPRTSAGEHAAGARAVAAVDTAAATR